MAKALRWLVCFLPPIAFVLFMENPKLGGLNGINAAGLIFLSPFLAVGGFALTAAIAVLTRWLGLRLRLRAKVNFSLLMLALIGLLSPFCYLEGDWLLLGLIEVTSLPAALLLARPPPLAGEGDRKAVEGASGHDAP